MQNYDMEFLQQYIRLDNLMKDMLSSSKGVSDYLEAMEDDTDNARRLSVPGWSEDFRTLRQLRHLRNQITHESGVSFCDEIDLDMLTAFYTRALHQDDPLCRLAMARQEQAQEETRREEAAAQRAMHARRWPWVLLFLLLLSCLIFLFWYVYH